MHTVLVENMSWPEFEEAMQGSDLVIVPVGSTEQHGFHNPLGTDTKIAYHCASMIGAKAEAPVLPAIPFGHAEGIKGFPGTLTLDTMLMRDFLFAYAENYVKHGARRFLFVRGHGGNKDAIELAMEDLHQAYGCVSFANEWWTTLPHLNEEWPCDDHGGHFETSMMMAVDESIIEKDQMQWMETIKLTENLERGSFRGVKISLPIPLEQINYMGNTGNPPMTASKSLGQEMMETYVDFNVRLVAAMRELPLSNPQDG